MTSKKTILKTKPKGNKVAKKKTTSKKSKPDAINKAKKKISKTKVSKTKISKNKMASSASKSVAKKTYTKEERQQLISTISNLLYVNRAPYMGSAETDWKQAEAVINFIMKLKNN